ncbi:hypothetical protein PRSY57_1338600 [Plasmodium reichenowi]|uniref:Uncharacterized protein n=1 Tax=Plasmodium reichenowi TaxID=5854 RepID=A0A151L7A5_PLARE|nr:hypothetical protein PRSY57_1338600 [Plasmodium reichenowi]KYN94822.1 hypothetical protein PRSY57_1338600 [Plasmodium reichenowi]
MHFCNKRSHFNFLKFHKNNIKRVKNNKKKEDDYLFLNKIKHKEKKKICFKNIFVPVCVINLSIFSFTLYNYLKKNDENYFDRNDITIIDHFVMNDLVSTFGVNNISIYLKNKLYDKLLVNIQDEVYISKENSLLVLMEAIYKNKKYFLQQKKKIQNNIKNKNNHIHDEHNQEKDSYMNQPCHDINNNRNNNNISMDIHMYNKNNSNVNNVHDEPFIYFLFESIKKNNINYSKKKILSSILFYYIKYSEDNLYLSYDQIWHLVYNPNLFSNLHNRGEIISYLLLKILRNQKCTDEIYTNEKNIIHKYIEMEKQKENRLGKRKNYSTDIQNQEQHMNKFENTIIFFLLSHRVEDRKGKGATHVMDKIKGEKKYVKEQNGKTNKLTHENNNNNNNNIDNDNDNDNHNGIKFVELPIYKFYKSFKKNEENYYKQQGLAQIQKYLNKINSTYLLEKNNNNNNNNNNNLIVKEKYNNIMNKIYWKFLENTILYTFIFSFVLHNMKSKEYNIKTYLYMFKDIYKSIYTNVLINSSILIQKSILNNINEKKKTNKFILTTLMFNLLNTFTLSLSIYKCKYALVPLLFSQVVKDNYFL